MQRCYINIYSQNMDIQIVAVPCPTSCVNLPRIIVVIKCCLQSTLVLTKKHGSNFAHHGFQK